MNHALIYQGSYELNFSRLAPGTRSYRSTDGVDRPLDLPPSGVDGIVIGYMERTGKKFSAVRIQFEDRDIVLHKPVALEPMRHMGGRRFAAQPIALPDDLASVLLDDAIARN